MSGDHGGGLGVGGHREQGGAGVRVSGASPAMAEAYTVAAQEVQKEDAVAGGHERPAAPSLDRICPPGHALQQGFRHTDCSMAAAGPAMLVSLTTAKLAHISSPSPLLIEGVSYPPRLSGMKGVGTTTRMISERRTTSSASMVARSPGGQGWPGR